MLKHGRAGVPMEVMGLMLGEFVDDYTVRVIDVFAMPQSGTVSATLRCCRLWIRLHLRSDQLGSFSDAIDLCLEQGVSVEAVDPVFQAKMLDMLKQTGR